MLKKTCLMTIILLCSLLTTSHVQANTKEENFQAINPLSPPPTRSPRSTMQSFLQSTERAIEIINEIYREGQRQPGLTYTPGQLARAADAQELMEQAVRTLNLSDVPEAYRRRVGIDRALMLREIFDRVALPDFDKVPGVNNLPPSEGDKKSELPKRWEVPGTEIAIEQGSKGKYVREYLFSVDTVSAIPQFYNDSRLEPSRADAKNPGFYHFYTSTPGDLLPYKWSSALPKWSKQYLYFDQTPWQWFGLGGVLLLMLFMSKGLLTWNFKRRNPDEYAFNDLLTPILIVCLILSVKYIIEYFLNITAGVFEVVSFALNAIVFIVSSWLVYVTVNYVSSFIWQTSNVSSLIDKSVIDTLVRLVSLIAATTVLYYGAVSLGVPIAPLVAGFGALGLAIGIGAQEYFKNVIGGLTLFIDRPVRVGESCEFKGIAGNVEDIGLRSTKIRTFDKRLVTVPNVIFSTSSITNYSRNRGRVLNKTFGLVYGTTQGQIQQILTELREYLDADPSVANHRVKLTNLGDYSLDIGVKVTLDSSDGGLFFDFQENLLFKAMSIVEAAGSDFAFPSQTLYMTRDESKETPS